MYSPNFEFWRERCFYLNYLDMVTSSTIGTMRRTAITVQVFTDAVSSNDFFLRSARLVWGKLGVGFFQRMERTFSFDWFMVGLLG